MNTLLYGHDTEECILAVHSADERTMRLYIRDATGIHHRDESFYPFFFLSNRSYLEDFSPKHWMKELEGTSHYRFVCAFESWSALWDAVRHVLDRFNRQSLTKIENYTSLDVLSLNPDPVTQYLLQSGKTLFKGMDFGTLRRLQLDIETYTSTPGRFSNAGQSGDRIILVALSDNSGWEHLVDGKNLTEEELLQETVRLIKERDPDVIEGHNIYEFDLPYILRRCEMNGVTFGIGRDGSAPHPPSWRTAETGRTSNLPITEVAGRHIIDTLLLVRNYDQTKHVMESHGLKYAAQFFGVASPERTYIRGENISWHWDHDPEPLRRYALDDVLETRGISDHLSGTYFYLAEMLPMSYSSVLRSGATGKIENLLEREYLRQRFSIPKPRQGFQTTGGYTDIFAVGILGPVLHVDIESLYPSIMISKSIRPATDTLGVFTRILKDLTSLRIRTKHQMLEAGDLQERSKLDAMQSSLKILINSFYGYLGYARGMFNDYSKADEVTRSGQELLKLMMSTLRARGGTVIEVDTDGIFLVPPPAINSPASEQEFVSDLSGCMPEGITVTLDGKYRKMLSYKKKNYALLAGDGKIIIKGSSLTSRSIEQFGRAYIRGCITCLLNDDINGLHTAYLETRDQIAERKLSIKDFAKVETLNDHPAAYREAVDAGKRTRSAAYEIALASDRRFRRGARVAYYVTGDDPNPRSFENCNAADDWDPNFRDENIPYYLRRIDEFSEKFQPFFTPRDFSRIFSVDDLFPFSPDGISLRTPELTLEASEHEQESDTTFDQ